MRPEEITNIQNLLIKGRVYIGPSSWLALFGKLTIEDGTIIGPRVKIHTANHNYDGEYMPYDKKFIVKDMHIRSKCMGWRRCDYFTRRFIG